MTPFTIVYGTILRPKTLKHLSPKELRAIRRAIEQKLTINPRVFGKPLRRSLKGCWVLRVGDYRVIYRIVGTMIEIYVIEHRSTVYKNFERQLGPS